jgi:hypothetical protein
LESQCFGVTIEALKLETHGNMQQQATRFTDYVRRYNFSFKIYIYKLYHGYMTFGAASLLDCTHLNILG